MAHERRLGSARRGALQVGPACWLVSRPAGSGRAAVVGRDCVVGIMACGCACRRAVWPGVVCPARPVSQPGRGGPARGRGGGHHGRLDRRGGCPRRDRGGCPPAAAWPGGGRLGGARAARGRHRSLDQRAHAPDGRRRTSTAAWGGASHAARGASSPLGHVRPMGAGTGRAAVRAHAASCVRVAAAPGRLGLRRRRMVDHRHLSVGAVRGRIARLLGCCDHGLWPAGGCAGMDGAPDCLVGHGLPPAGPGPRGGEGRDDGQRRHPRAKPASRTGTAVILTGSSPVLPGISGCRCAWAG